MVEFSFSGNYYLQVVNFGSNSVKPKMSLDGLDPNSIKLSGVTMTVLTSSNVMDENSFKEPNKVYIFSLELVLGIFYL